MWEFSPMAFGKKEMTTKPTGPGLPSMAARATEA
jgi:hypothetical protein